MSKDLFEKELDEAARHVASTLKEHGKKIVFAESCTGGKMAAAMTTVPGISRHFCGSAVTYREATKTQWLSIPKSEIDEHTAESEQTTVAMAKSVLRETPEADFAIAITGHLGPGVNHEIDGIVFVVVAGREMPEHISTQHELCGADRRARQAEAAVLAFTAFLNTV